MTRRLAVQPGYLAIGVGAAAACASAVAAALGVPDAAPPPFYWRDVALVCFVCSLPLAALLAARLVGPKETRPMAGLLTLQAIVLLVVPALYVQARCQSDAARVVGLIEQSRFGEAQALLDRLLALHPRAAWKGFPLRRSAAELNDIVDTLTKRVAARFPVPATDEDRLNRVRDLAMLGRTSEAIDILESSPTLRNAPDGCNLLGTIYESRGSWRLGVQWYSRALDAWQPLADSPKRTAGLVRAATGVGFCERKLGHLVKAEAAYQSVLELSPGAHSHFLLAQFYEDTQQAAKAQTHARQAMALDPARYGAEGQKLIDKLVTLHFGCWGVFGAERDRLPHRPAASEN